jgi:uncharacterized protein with HEPN domain
VSQTPERLIEEALEHLAAVRAHLAHVPYHPDVALDAVCHRLATAIDRVGQLPPDMREAACGGGWRDARALRNRIVHGYRTVDPHLVLRAIEREVEPLERGLADAAESLREATT